MPIVKITTANNTLNGTDFLVDLQADMTYGWTTNCTQTVGSSSGLCSAQPTEVNATSTWPTDNLTLNNSVSNTYLYGGYKFTASNATEKIRIYLDENTYSSSTTEYLLADSISQDEWNYKYLIGGSGAGALALGYNSHTLERQKYQNITKIYYEPGWIVNQTWASDVQDYTAPSSVNLAIGHPQTLPYQQSQVSMNSTRTD